MKKYHIRGRVRKSELRPDRFQQLTEKIVEFYYRDRQRAIMIVIIGIVAVAGLIYLFQNRQASGVNPEAQLRFTEALGMYAQGDMEAAEEAFNNVAAGFRRDNVGIRARYYLGQIHFHNQRYDEARTEFERFLKSRPDDPVLAPAALLGIADCYQETGNHLRAAENYERVWRRYPDFPLAVDAAMAAGRNYIEAGSMDRAERLYRSLLDQGAVGEQVENIKMQLSYIMNLKEKF